MGWVPTNVSHRCDAKDGLGRCELKAGHDGLHHYENDSVVAAWPGGTEEELEQLRRVVARYFGGEEVVPEISRKEAEDQLLAAAESVLSPSEECER